MALPSMSEDGIKHEGKLRGSLKNERFKRNSATKGIVRYDARFIGTMRRFCAKPPAPIEVDRERLQLDDDVTRVAFWNHKFLAAELDRVEAFGQVKLVLDGTYKTNAQRLVLLGIGAVHLVVDGDRVHNRLVPMMFMLAHTEDTDAYGRWALVDELALQPSSSLSVHIRWR